MFQKMKDIKRKIYIAKVFWAVAGVLFILMIIATIYMCIQVHDLKQRIEVLEYIDK